MGQNINLGFTNLPYGGDWNPEQWERAIWDEDVRIFKMAGINILSINIFAWTLDQPDEETWNFQWLDAVISLLKKNDLKVCLGTATAAHPAWMATKYPDILRTDFKGRKRKFGDRHNSCPSSPTYRKFATRIAGALAQRYKAEPAVVLWHVSNEFSGECYCENCEKKFRLWLKARYLTLQALNDAWNTRFWSQTITDWDQIVVPNELTVQWGVRSTSLQGLVLDYCRFNSDNILEGYKLERDAIKEFIPEAVVTTNLMGAYRSLNYRQWAREMDIISWDNYPSPDHDYAYSSMMHDLMRGLKEGQSFLLMEQTPSQTNWQPYNALKRPGVMRLWSWQAVAHGADSIMFFQMRRSVGACEKFHGAVIDHSGRTDTRVFQEVAELGRELEAVGGEFAGARVPAQAALWFDWETWWAVENSAGPTIALRYVDEVYKYYRPFNRLGVPLDMVGPGSDLSAYKLLFAPVLYMLKPGVAERLRDFVHNGGILLTTYLSGVADASDRVFRGGAPGPLSDLLGIWEEEIDALAPEQYNSILMRRTLGPLEPDREYKCNLVFSLVRIEDAEEMAVYGSDFYKGRAALTRKQNGSGEAWYVASSADVPFLEGLVSYMINLTGIQPLFKNIAEDIEVSRRSLSNQKSVYFILNHSEELKQIDLGDTILTAVGTSQILEGVIDVRPKDVIIAFD